MKVLILSTGTGEGHNSAYKALAKYTGDFNLADEMTLPTRYAPANTFFARTVLQM